MAIILDGNRKNIAIVLGLLYAVEVVASISCNVPILLAPLAALALVGPAALVGFAFSKEASCIPAMVGIFSVAIFLVIAYRFDCGGWGIVFPSYYGIPTGLLTGWLTSRVLREKVDNDH